MNKSWEPTFDDWPEERVNMSSCRLPTSSMSRGEYGVMMLVEKSDDSIPVDAAIFWTDEMHLYLRYDWETWYRVSTEDPDNCSNICKRNSATLLMCTPTSMKHHSIKVYHIDHLPQELFGRQTNKTRKNGTGAKANHPPPYQQDLFGFNDALQQTDGGEYHDEGEAVEPPDGEDE